MTLLKIRIPMIVTADGKWAAQGSLHTLDEPDWSFIDETCDYDEPTINPQRYWIETVVEIPEMKTVRGVAVPEPPPQANVESDNG